MHYDDDIKALLAREYDLEAQVRRLPGELDLNFDISAASDRYVLKLMRKGCDPDFVNMQIMAMDHVRGTLGVPKIPEIVRTVSGASYFTHPDAEGADRVGWLITFLSGTMMADVDGWTPELATSIGEKIAYLDSALVDFDHPLLDRKFKWDLRRAGWIKDHLDVFENAWQRQMITAIVDRCEIDIYPSLDGLPTTPIYGDANDMNVLVAEHSGRQTVSGIIDFGDMHRSPRICEPAIAMAYAMMRDPDPIARGAALIRGFHSVIPLDVEEIDLLSPLLKLRLATSVTNAAIETAKHPDNQYLSVSEAPAWQLLHDLANYDEQDVINAFREACGV